MKWALSPGLSALISASLITAKVVLAIILTVSLAVKLPRASKTDVVMFTVFKTLPWAEPLTLALKYTVKLVLALIVPKLIFYPFISI